jgi:hypothetical protein
MFLFRIIACLGIESRIKMRRERWNSAFLGRREGSREMPQPRGEAMGARKRDRLQETKRVDRDAGKIQYV